MLIMVDIPVVTTRLQRDKTDRLTRVRCAQMPHPHFLYFQGRSNTTLPFICEISKDLIRPVVSCGAEAWTLMKKEEQAVLFFERKIFRRIYGPKYEIGEWKSRTNREL